MKITSRSFISVVFVCFIRSTKGASLGTDRKNIHGSCPLQFKALTSTMDTNCRYRITNETTQLQYALQNNIKWEDGTTRPIHIKILTEGNDTIRTTTDILFPNQWMLSYIDPNGPYYYVSWRSDFKILSLGLLNGITDKPIQVDIRELSGNCTSILGSDDTTTYIVQVMTSFIRQAAVLGDDHDYENINLCYLTKFDWFLNSGWYLLKQYFGIPFQEFGYKCCMMRNDTVCCDDRLHAIEGYRVVPYLIAVVLIFYFPIILMKIGNSLQKFDDKSYLKDFSSHSINQKLDNSNSDDDFVSVFLINPFFLGLSNHDDQKVTDETGSQENNCCYVVNMVKDHLKLRLKRFVFLILAPMFIYIELIIFFLIPEWKTTIHQINKNHLLFGFTSMEDGVLNNEFLYPIGPFPALIVYYVLGICILVSFDDFENSVLDRGRVAILKKIVYLVPQIPRNEIENENGEDVKEATIQIKNRPQSNATNGSSNGYIETERVLTTLMFLPLNPLFWKSIKGNRRMLFILVLPFVVLPLIPFCVLIIIGWGKCEKHYIDQMFSCSCKEIKNDENKSDDKSVKKSNLFCVRSCLVVGITFIPFAMFSYMFILVISYSIYLLIYVMYFVSIAFIISPNETSKYLIFFIWGCIFLFQTWRDFKNYYKNLFDMIVKVCEGKDQLKQKFIVSKDHAEYIKEEIIKVVFSKLSPVYVQIGHIILKFALVILVYVSSILFLNTNSEQLADLIEHITVLATSALPVIIQYQFKTICPTERLVKYTIDSNLLEETNRDFDMR